MARPTPLGARLNARERDQLESLGYVVRERAFDLGEVAQMAADCEAMVQKLLERSVGRRKHSVGSYMFQLERGLVSMVKWEPAFPDVVQGVEPFAHFDESLRDWANDGRFVEPMKDVVGAEKIDLFTEKLNVKRAHTGGPIVLHQDYPYWTDNSDGPGEIGTAIVFLDDATRTNGCLEVLPGSHTRGVWPMRQVDGFGANEMKLEGFDESKLVPVEVPAGSAVYFGSLLVHRSLNNTSDGDRRALLYSYQPAGRIKAIDGFMKLVGSLMAARRPAVTGERAAKRQRRLGRILEAAERQFAAHGFAKATIDEIAAEADVSKGLVYDHYASKEELLAAVWVRLVEAWMRAVREAKYDDSSVAASLGEMVRVSLRYVRETPLLRRIIAEDPANLTPGGMQGQMAFGRDYRAALEPVLAHGVRTGELRADLDVAHTAEVLWLLHFALTREFFVNPRRSTRADADELLEAALAMIVGGLRAPGGKRR